MCIMKGYSRLLLLIICELDFKSNYTRRLDEDIYRLTIFFLVLVDE